jgi:NodT family efflux transporter outer membrane factor (OMF) lipoprotein
MTDKRHAILFAAIALGACKVGPDYAGPPKLLVGESFARKPVGLSAEAAVAPWWQALGDGVLDRLVGEALAQNPSVAEAEARIAQAGAILRQRQVSDLPSVSPSLIGAKADLPSFTGSGKRTSLEVYNLGATASWEPDFWGAARRTNEAARASLAERQAQAADVQVSLSAQVVQAYVNLRDAQARRAMLERSAQGRTRALDMMVQRQAAGTATQADVAAAQGNLQSAQAQIAPVAGQIAVAMNQLAVLTGKAPGALDASLAGPAPLPRMPAQVAVGSPASLIAHRPDIRAAERNLAGATAQVGATKASLLPHLKWSGLDWGKGRASQRQAQAQRDMSEAQYRRVVLSALEDAESSLARFGAARVRLGHLAMAAHAAEAGARLGEERVKAGTSSPLEQIDRDTRAMDAQMARSQAEADLLVAYVGVAKSLGLGWRD